MKRILIFLLFLLFLSSTKKAPVPVEKPKEQIKTRPAPYFHRPRKMLANNTCENLILRYNQHT